MHKTFKGHGDITCLSRHFNPPFFKKVRINGECSHGQIINGLVRKLD